MAGAGELVRMARENRRDAIRPQARTGERIEGAAARGEIARQPEVAARQPVPARPGEAMPGAGVRADAGSRPGAGVRADAGSMPDTGARPDAGSRSKFQPHHGAYSALMRSHDRMRTQHLPVQGNGSRA